MAVWQGCGVEDLHMPYRHSDVHHHSDVHQDCTRLVPSEQVCGLYQCQCSSFDTKPWLQKPLPGGEEGWRVFYSISVASCESVIISKCRQLKKEKINLEVFEDSILWNKISLNLIWKRKKKRKPTPNQRRYRRSPLASEGGTRTRSGHHGVDKAIAKRKRWHRDRIESGTMTIRTINWSL